MTIDLAVEITDDTVKAAAFRRLPDEEWRRVIDDDHILAFTAAARALVADLQAQLGTLNLRAGVSEVIDPDKRRRLGVLHHRVAALCAYLRPLAADCNRRASSASHSLVAAIRLHRETVLAEYDPTPADEELWAVLGGGQA